MTTTTTPLARTLARLAPVGLAELIDRAALQTRVDRKYLVPVDALPRLLGGLPADTRVLDVDGARTFHYESVYFDTPLLTSFHCAAYRRRRRFRCAPHVPRLRPVLAGGQDQRRGGSVTKHRLPYHPGTAAPCTRTAFIDEALDRESLGSTTDSPSTRC
ncbi:hypothetical protein K7G98_18670 [Saccharothrix sp. MB29]|nr:hypothetical protein [Saccharothrix sp. MB29]